MRCGIEYVQVQGCGLNAIQKGVREMFLLLFYLTEVYNSIFLGYSLRGWRSLHQRMNNVTRGVWKLQVIYDGDIDFE